MDASLRQLLAVTSTFEFEEFGSASLGSAAWDGHDITRGVTLRQQGRPEQWWDLCCASVRDSRVRGGRAFDGPSLESEHPLLLPYVSPVVELYFNGRPDDANAVVAELVEAHHAVVADWFGWTHFLNVTSHVRPHHLLGGGFGSFARGPQRLIEAYARVLARHGVAASSPPASPPLWWDGARFVEEAGALYALIRGDSYVVSPTVTARRR